MNLDPKTAGFSVVHIDGTTGILLNRIRPHLQIRKSHLTSEVHFASELEARGYANETSQRYSHVTCLVQDASKNLLHETPAHDATWFEHPVPNKFSRRIERILEKRRTRPWYPFAKICILFAAWLNSGITKRLDNHGLDAVASKASF